MLFFNLGVLKYVVCLCKGCDGCCAFRLYLDAWSCRCSCMGSMSVSSGRCCIFVSCVHPVAVLNAAFCMTSFLMLFEDATGDHMEETPNDTSYTRCSCHSSLANPVHIVSTPPAPSKGGQITVFGQACHAEPMDGWQCSS